MNPTGKLLVLLLLGFLFLVAIHDVLAPLGFGATATAIAACEPRERDALLAFKRGITNDTLGLLTSWKQDDHDCCQWTGITCSNLTGHVIELRLNGKYVEALEGHTPQLETAGLVGQISPELLYLDHVEHLDLSINLLHGPTGVIPKFLGSMNSLRYLNLSGNPFTGMVPPQLGNLSKLQYLDLSDVEGMTHITDISWVSRLGSLQYLDLSFVNLSIATDWAHAVNLIPSITVLRLSSCQLQSANQSLAHYNLTKLEKLDLSDNYFDHQYASCWFWNSTNLKYIDLSFNSLYGQFPTALGEMTSLVVLDLSSNSQYGIMAPNLLRNLCSLEVLNIGFSLLAGNITELFESLPHCSPSKLWELKMSYNHINGTLPAGFFRQFSNLVTLDLSNNMLTGPLPADIGMLSSLTQLDLFGNNLTGVITEVHFANLKSLKFIDLYHNHLKIVVDPRWLAPYFGLEVAQFASCHIGPKFPHWLQWSVDIRHIDISRTGINDKLPEWFWTTFSKVTYVDMSNNQLRGSLRTNMEIMELETRLPTNLTTLDVFNNSLSGSQPSELGTQDQMYGLIPSSHNLSGPIPASLCEMQNLFYLDLSNNLFEGEFPQCFGIRKIKVILLSNNRFSGMFPAFMEGSTELELIDLSRNNFSGELPMWIGDNKELCFLGLSYNDFSGSIPVNIISLPNLRHLDLAGNSLSGNIPWALSNLEAMKQDSYNISFDSTIQGYENLFMLTKRQELKYGYEILKVVSIDLSSNRLVGGIPEEIASLSRLKNLNLSWNFLNGKIPEKIGSLYSLESLDISRNKLSGEIPSSLSNLSFLSDLDLSHNNLSGKIPSGSQLDTLYVEHPDMYDGNSGLCGPPIQKSCSGSIAPKQGYDNQKKAAHLSEPKFFCLGLISGLVVGLWVVFCIMLFKKTWRVAYFRTFDKICDKMYVISVVTWARLTKKPNW